MFVLIPKYQYVIDDFRKERTLGPMPDMLMVGLTIFLVISLVVYGKGFVGVILGLMIGISLGPVTVHVCCGIVNDVINQKNSNDKHVPEN